LGPDRKKLSKRHGVTSVLHFKEKGYLSLALFNFLAQMSWSPGTEERIYSVEEMVREFSLEKLSKGSPIFDLAKLEWLNSQLISQMAAGELSPFLKEELKKNNLWKEELDKEQKAWYSKLIDILKERSRTIQELAENARPFLSDEYSFDSDGIEKYLKDERLRVLLPKLKEDFSRISDFRAPQIEQALRARAEKEGVKAALFIHALRMLVLGKCVSPGIFEVIDLIGKERILERMDKIHTILNGQMA
jgi:glutamyl-tRNA synthetase/nondiscriminating glutamyl-tRNA synthetase